MRVEPLRVVGKDASQDDEDWESLLKRVMGGDATKVDEEAEWRAQLDRVKADLEEEQEWTATMARAKVSPPDEDGEWSTIIARARSVSESQSVPKPVLPGAQKPVAKATESKPTVRGKRAAPRVSKPPRVTTPTAPLSFTLPGESSESGPIREEITKVVAKSGAAPAGAPLSRATPRNAITPKPIPAKTPVARTSLATPVRTSVTGPAAGMNVQAPVRATAVQAEAKRSEHATPKVSEPTSAPVAERTSAPAVERTSAPVAERTSVPAVERTSTSAAERTSTAPRTSMPPAQRLSMPAAQRSTMPPVQRTSTTEPRPSVIESRPSLTESSPRRPPMERTSVPQPAPSQARRSSPGLTALRVAANSKRSASDSGVRPVVKSQPVAKAQPRVERTSAPVQKPVEEKKDSSLVGLSVALEHIERTHATRPSRVSPPPPPRVSVAPSVSAVRTGTPTSSAATSPVRPTTPSGLPALRVPPPPPARALSASKPRKPLAIPPPPPPSKSVKPVHRSVVQRMRSAVATLTGREKSSR